MHSLMKQCGNFFGFLARTELPGLYICKYSILLLLVLPSLKPLPGERILGCQQGPWIPRSLEANSVPPPVQSKAEPPPSYGLISHQEKTLHMLGN